MSTPINPLGNALYFERGLSDGNIWACLKCQSHIVLSDSVISYSRFGLYGRALLCGDAINLQLAHQERIELDWGQHIISRVQCSRCKHQIGCKILRAPMNVSERTVGKYLLDLEDVILVKYIA